LALFDHYFCSVCGTKLPEGLVLPPVPATVEIPVLHVARKRLTLNIPLRKVIHRIATSVDRRTLFELVIVLSIVVIAVVFNSALRNSATGISNDSMVTESSESSTTPALVTVPEKRILTSQLDLNSGPFNSNALLNMVPADVVLLMEVNTYKWPFFQLSSPFFDDIPHFFGEDYFADSFVFFATKDASTKDSDFSWGFVFKLKKDIPEEVYTSALEEFSWSGVVIDSDKFVFAKDPAVLDLVTNAYSGIAKNITLNPHYVTAVRKLPKDGQMRIMFFGFDGKRALKSLITPETSFELSNLIDRILDFGYNEVVLK